MKYMVLFKKRKTITKRIKLLNWTGKIHTVTNATTEMPQMNLRARLNIRGSDHFCHVRKIKITLKLKGRIEHSKIKK